MRGKSLAFVAAVCLAAGISSAATASASSGAAGSAVGALAAARPAVSTQPAEAPLKAVTAEPWSTTFVDLKGYDGIKIGANVTVPKTPGLHPLIVIPASWGGGDTQNIVPSWRLAERGYVVVNYAARGFGDSGGDVGLGSADDMTDMRTVIDWALANTASDPDRIGLFGISYAGGLVLLDTAFDPRIKVVVAMEGWADLERALIPNNTRAGLVALSLRVTGTVNGHFSADTQSKFDDFFANRNIPALKDWARARSPLTYIATTNHNGPAIMIQQEWEESVFPDNQMVDYFNQLTGPKRLELMPGDHISHFTSGLAGLPNIYIDSMIRWFDAHLSGIDPTIATEKPIKLVPRGPNGQSAPEFYDTWSAVTARADVYRLGPQNWFGPGPLAPDAATGWADTITSGFNLVSGNQIPLFNGSAEAFTGHPAAVNLSLIDRGSSAVWTGSPLPAGAKIRGSAAVHLTVTPTAATGTVIAYLYDLAPDGTAYLIGYTPSTWIGATPGRALPTTLTLSPQAYDMPKGHRVAVVVSTKDLDYTDMNALGAKMTFSSPAADPSTVSIPLG